MKIAHFLNSLPFLKFATNEAIQRTEAYEYAQSLGAQSGPLPNFQVSLRPRGAADRRPGLRTPVTWSPAFGDVSALQCSTINPVERRVLFVFGVSLLKYWSFWYLVFSSCFCIEGSGCTCECVSACTLAPLGASGAWLRTSLQSQGRRSAVQSARQISASLAARPVAL